MEHAPSAPRELNLAQLFRIPFQVLVVELHDRLADEGFGDVRPAHTSVFAHIGQDGARLTELAERAQLTKQLMNYLVNYCEEHGYVERIPDPLDRRAKLICLTERGTAAWNAGRRIIRSIEAEWTEQIGAENMQSLRGQLEALVNVVGQQRE
jgi:DNA-binding MarR family transcriptional regulator